VICSASSRDRGRGIATPLTSPSLGGLRTSSWLKFEVFGLQLSEVASFIPMYTFCLFSFKKLTLGSVSGMVDLLNILREGWNEDAVEGFFLLLSGIDSLSY